jgi:hypothetical protein
VPSTERLSASGVVLFDAHLRVTEADNLCFSTRTLNIDGRLLWAAGGSEWFVECDLSAFIGSHYFFFWLLLTPSSWTGFLNGGIPSFLKTSDSMLGFCFVGLLVGFFIGLEMRLTDSMS